MNTLNQPTTANSGYLKSFAQQAASAAFPWWSLKRVNLSDQRQMLAAILAWKPSTVRWESSSRNTGWVDVSNEDYLEIGIVSLSPSSAARLVRFRNKHANTYEARQIVTKALSGLVRHLDKIPPGGMSDSALSARLGHHVNDDRNSPWTDELKLAFSSFSPRGLPASPDPLAPGFLISRGVRVCSIQLAEILAKRGHLVAEPDGTFRRRMARSAT